MALALCEIVSALILGLEFLLDSYPFHQSPLRTCHVQIIFLTWVRRLSSKHAY